MMDTVSTLPDTPGVLDEAPMTPVAEILPAARNPDDVETIFLSYKFDLRLHPKQHELLARALEDVRQIRNAVHASFLHHKRLYEIHDAKTAHYPGYIHGRDNKLIAINPGGIRRDEERKYPTLYNQYKELTAWLNDAQGNRWLPVSLYRSAIKHLHDSYKLYWKRLENEKDPKKRAKIKPPKFQGFDYFNTFGCLDKNGWKYENGKLYIDGIGFLDVIATRDLPGVPKTFTITREPRGGARRAGGLQAYKWTVRFVVAVPVAEKPPEGGPIGIDMGVTHQITTSEGDHIAAPDEKDINKEIKKAQRELSRHFGKYEKRADDEEDDKKRKVKKKKLRKAALKTLRARKIRQRLSKLNRKKTNIRVNHAHQVTSRLAKKHRSITTENLPVGNMTRSAKGTIENPGTNVAAKSGLNREILRAGWGRIDRMLAYKCPLNGGKYERVDPRNTSRRCNACGHTQAENRKGEQFRCVSCGHPDQADKNAAKNIRDRGGDAPGTPYAKPRAKRVSGKAGTEPTGAILSNPPIIDFGPTAGRLHFGTVSPHRGQDRATPPIHPAVHAHSSFTPPPSKNLAPSDPPPAAPRRRQRSRRDGFPAAGATSNTA